MKKKVAIIVTVMVIFLGLTGFLVYKTVTRTKNQPVVTEDKPADVVPELDASVVVNVSGSRVKDDAVVLTVTGLAQKMTTVSYELTYDSQGLIKGVNSGSHPIDLTGKDNFEREVYMGTCSRNVCKPDPGVKKVSVALEFTDAYGKKSQFTKDFDI